MTPEQAVNAHHAADRAAAAVAAALAALEVLRPLLAGAEWGAVAGHAVTLARMGRGVDALRRRLRGRAGQGS